jgi:hypothetical protein
MIGDLQDAAVVETSLSQTGVVVALTRVASTVTFAT